jgi:tetratricopeptide (TPR) repeat protein
MLGTIRLQQGKYQESENFLTEALHLNPQLVGARINLGEADVLLGRPEAAGRNFEQALKRDPTNFNARFDLAKVESSLQRFQRSLELASPIAPQLKQREDGILLLASDYAGLDKKQNLTELVESWRQLPGPADDASLDFAGILAAHGMVDSAKDILGDVEDRTAGHPSAPLALKLAKAYQALGSLTRAQKNSELAISLDPNCAQCELVAAQIAEQQGNTEKALAYLIPAKKLEPENPEVLFEFGRVCLMRDLLEDALPALEKAVELTPDRDSYVYVLASANVGRGNLDKAAALLSGLLRKHPQDAIFNYALGTVYYLQQKYPQAEASFKASLASQPDQVGSSYYLALTYDDTGRGDQAAVLLRGLIKEHPDHAPSQLKLGTILSRDGKYATAEPYLRRAIALDPNSAGAHYRVGLVLKQLGKTAESEEEFAQSRKVHTEQESQTHMHMRLLLPE